MASERLVFIALIKKASRPKEGTLLFPKLYPAIKKGLYVKSHKPLIRYCFIGRGDRIRTYDSLVPN